MTTMGDDIFYSTSTTGEFLKESLGYSCPVVVSHCFSAITQDNLDNCPSCIKWKQLTNKLRDKMFFGSGGGTLFPPGVLCKDVYNIGPFQGLVPFTDDIWLNVMCRLQGTKIVSAKKRSTSLLPVINLINVALIDENIGNSLNDKQIRSVREYYLREGIDPFVANGK